MLGPVFSGASFCGSKRIRWWRVGIDRQIDEVASATLRRTGD